MGLQRVRHDWATSTPLHFTSLHDGPLQEFLPSQSPCWCQLLWLLPTMDFLGSSDGKESACNAGDPGSIPGLGRTPEEGNSYPLQYSCPESSMDRGAWRAAVHGVTESGTSEWLTLITLFLVFTVMLWVRDNHHHSYFINGVNHGPGRLSIWLVIPGLWEHRSRRTESSQIWLQGHIWSVPNADSLYVSYPFWRPGPFIQYFLRLYGGPRLVAEKQGRHASCLCRVSRLSFLYSEVWSQFRESQLTLQREDTGMHQTSWYFTKPLWNCVYSSSQYKAHFSPVGCDPKSWNIFMRGFWVGSEMILKQRRY